MARIKHPVKKPPVNLQLLVEVGMIHIGQELHFKFTKQLSNRYQAKVSGRGLFWNDKIYSMSALVGEILKIEGYDIPSGAYRGPAYWFDDKGRSVKDLWKQYLSRR